MSADNVIYVQRQEDGRYAIWQTQMSEENTEPSNASYEFTLEEALAYARGWLRGEWVVEYGVQVLSPKYVQSTLVPITPLAFDFVERQCLCVQVVVDKDGNFIPYECVCSTDSGK